MFKVNDYVIYGSTGVCKVIGVGVPDMDYLKKDTDYYKLEAVYMKGSTIYTPVDSEKARIRPILTKEEAEQLIDDIDSIETIWSDNDKNREKEYKEAMLTNDCREWIKIIKTLYVRNKERKAEGKKITATDERYMHAAEENLYGELSISLGMDKGDVQEYIFNRV